MITSKQERNKSARSAWTKKGLDPNLRPEWLVRKSQKPVENSRIMKKEPDSPGQRNQVIDQVNTRLRDKII